jgi:hypothetical protein
MYLYQCRSFSVPSPRGTTIYNLDLCKVTDSFLLLIMKSFVVKKAVYVSVAQLVFFCFFIAWTPITRTHIFTPMNTRTQILPLWAPPKDSVRRSRDSRNHHRHLAVDGDVAYHWKHSADKSWNKSRKIRAPVSSRELERGWLSIFFLNKRRASLTVDTR